MRDKVDSENMGLLGGFPELATINDPLWQSIVATASPVRMPAGTTILTHQDRCRDFLLLYSGTVRVEETSAQGRDIVLYRLQPGDICILSVLSLMKDAPFAARAVTETPIEGLTLTVDQFNQALAQLEAFRSFILTTMAGRLHEVMALVSEIAFQRLDTRLASTLYHLFERQPNDSIRITHQQLAAELGSTREVVSRMLKEFEDKSGCIRLHRGRIELLSRPALRAYVEPYSDHG